MIERADARVVEWAQTIVGTNVSVALASPADGNAGAGVSVFLMELAAQPPMRGERRAPLQLALRYLVTTWAGDPSTEHRLLGALVLAAMQEEDFEVQLAPLPVPAWAALGASPRPSFMLQVRLRQPRPEPVRRPVRGPLVVRDVALVELAGVVLGPGGVPVAGARVEVPSAGASAETDPGGRFLLRGMPARPERKLVRVRARGRQLEVEIAQPAGAQPVVIHFDQLLEG